MWKRRKPGDIEDIERRKRRSRSRFNPLVPFRYSLVISVFLTLMRWGGFKSRFAGWGDPVPVADVLRFFPYGFEITFVMVYGLQLLGIHLNNDAPPVVICNHCQTVHPGRAGDQCPCGGKFEPLEHWRWFREDRKYVCE